LIVIHKIIKLAYQIHQLPWQSADNFDVFEWDSASAHREFF